MADAAWERDDAVVREDVAVERVERRVVDVGREHPLLEIVEDDGLRHAAEPAKRLLVELRPDPRTRLPGQEPDRLAAVAEGENEEARAAVLAGLRMADHRAVAVVDLRLLARRGEDHRMGLGRARPAQSPHEAADARVAGREAVAVDEVLPDGHRVAPAPERLDDHLAVRLAGARLRAAAGPRGPGRRRRVGGHLIGRFCRRVGGHPVGRFWDGPPAPAAGRPDGDPGGFQVRARRLPADAGRLLDPTERPPQPPQHQHLVSLRVAQDVGHPGDEPEARRPLNV